MRFCGLDPCGILGLVHYFINIVTDTERIVDPDGQDFADLEAARVEAVQCARDLMAGELAAGRPVPLGWRMHVSDAGDSVLLAIPFAALLFGEGYTPLDAAWKFRRVSTPELRMRAEAINRRARQVNGDIHSGLETLWSGLRTLSQLNADLGKRVR